MRGMIGEEQGPASSEPKREPTWDSDAESALIDLTASPSPADAGEMEPEVTVTAAPSCPNSPGVAAAASNRRLRGKTPSGDQFDEAAKALIEMRERIAKDVGKKSFQEEAAFPKPGPKVKSEVAASTTHMSVDVDVADVGVVVDVIQRRWRSRSQRSPWRKPKSDPREWPKLQRKWQPCPCWRTTTPRPMRMTTTTIRSTVPSDATEVAECTGPIFSECCTDFSV